MAYGSVLGQSQSVLSPATAIKMGLEPTASADDAFDKLTDSVLQKEMVVGQDIAWEEKKFGNSFDGKNFIQRGNDAVWIGDTTNLCYTKDNFNSIQIKTIPNSYLLFYLKGKYFTVSATGVINYSSDLITWQEDKSNLLYQDWAVTQSNSYQWGCAGNEYAYVAILKRKGVKIYRSNNGLDWELFLETTNSKMTGPHSMAAFNGGFAIGGNYNESSNECKFMVVSDSKEIVFELTGQWYNQFLQLFSDDINNKIFITTNLTVETTNLWFYDIYSKKLDRTNYNPKIAENSNFIFVGDKYYYVATNNNFNAIDKDLTKISTVYTNGGEKFFYDEVSKKLILYIGGLNASIKYGTLTPIIENQLTNIQGAPIQIPSSQILNGVRMATGSYVGNGKVGESNPNNLTFDFEPKYLMVFGVQNKGFVGGLYGNDNWKQLIFYMDGVESIPVVNERNGTTILYISKNENTLSWYSTADAWAQLNAPDVTYNYIAFG